ncbi:serine hydrolase domain-containing protein [Sphingopyxis fribergensis]
MRWCPSARRAEAIGRRSTPSRATRTGRSICLPMEPNRAWGASCPRCSRRARCRRASRRCSHRTRSSSRAWRAADLPALNGHGSAMGVAKLYAAMLAPDGPCSPATVARMTAVAADRPDLVLGFNPGWGMGVAHNRTGMFGPDPATFGHSGWGGSFGCGDPASGIAIGYACNHMGPDLVGDPRATVLCAAVIGKGN